MRDFAYLKPDTLKEAVALLMKFGEHAQLMNGGTDLVVRMRGGIAVPDVVIDIKHIEKLCGIDYDEEKGLTIGACVTLNEVCDSDVVSVKYPFLAKAARSIASKQVRNRATCIGNICNASPLADTATPLLVLDAIVQVYGPDGEREIDIHDFFLSVKQTCLSHDDIVTGIRIPNVEVNQGRFRKISRRPTVDLSTVCSTVVRIGDEIRIAYGAVAPTPVRAWKTESYLAGKKITEDVIEAAVEIVAEDVAPIDDVRASADYRMEMVKVMLRRHLSDFIE